MLDGGGRYRGKFPQIGGDGHPAKAAGHLQKNLRVVGVDPFGHLPGRTYKLNRVVGGVGAVGHPVLLNLVIHKGDPGKDQAHTALGPGSIVVDPPLVKAPLGVTQAQGAHGSHRKSIFQFGLSDSNLGEK